MFTGNELVGLGAGGRVTVEGAGAGAVTVRVPSGRATGLWGPATGLVTGAGAGFAPGRGEEDRFGPDSGGVVELEDVLEGLFLLSRALGIPGGTYFGQSG